MQTPSPRRGLARLFGGAALAGLLLLAACAESDPYKRMEPGVTSEIAATQLVEAYNNRWPEQFKCVQTVTLDFGPVTRTFSALLIIQRPGKFRLQAMTEQGLKIFDLAHDGLNDQVVFKGDDISDKVIEGISRDIRRVFLEPFSGVPSAGHDGACFHLEGNTPQFTLRALLAPGNQLPAGAQEWSVRQTRAAWVDRVEKSDEQGRIFCFANYEWRYPRTTDEEERRLLYPGVIVLRDSGRESRSYPYKLTIKITELTLRNTPWPEKTFKP